MEPETEQSLSTLTVDHSKGGLSGPLFHWWPRYVWRTSAVHIYVWNIPFNVVKQGNLVCEIQIKSKCPFYALDSLEQNASPKILISRLLGSLESAVDS